MIAMHICKQDAAILCSRVLLHKIFVLCRISGLLIKVWQVHTSPKVAVFRPVLSKSVSLYVCLSNNHLRDRKAQKVVVVEIRSESLLPFPTLDLRVVIVELLDLDWGRGGVMGCLLLDLCKS